MESKGFTKGLIGILIVCLMIAVGAVPAFALTVINPGAETGAKTPWVQFDISGTGTTSATDAAFYSGSYCFKYDSVGPANRKGGLYQRIQVQPNTSYTMSCYILCAGSNAAAQIGVNKDGTEGLTGWNAAIKNTSKTYASWASSGNVTVTSGSGGYITIFITYTGTAAGQRFAHFDNIAVTGPDPVLGPNPPTNPGATNITSSSIRWTWTDASSNETGFKVYAGAGATAPSTVTTTTAADATYYDYGSLGVNTQHSFQVASTNAGGDSAKTTNLTKYTLAETPSAPTVNNPLSGSLDVNPNLATNPASTQLAIKVSTGGSPIGWVQAGGTVDASPAWQTDAAWGGATPKTVTGLTNGTEYTFQVRARNGDNVETGDSDETAGTPDSTCVAVEAATPTGTLTVCSGNTTDLTETPSAGTLTDATYKWQINTGGGWADCVEDTDGENVTSATMTTASTAVNGTQYRCVVTNCSSVNSDTSDPVTLTVNSGPGAPTKAEATDIGLATITWNWTAGSGTTVSYKLWDAETGGNQIGGTITNTYLAESGLQKDTQYSRWVEAVNDCDTSARAALDPATTLARTCPENAGFETFTDELATTAADTWIGLQQAGTGATYPSSTDRNTGALSQRIQLTSTNSIAWVYQTVKVVGGYNYMLNAYYKEGAAACRAMIHVDPAGGTDFTGNQTVNIGALSTYTLVASNAFTRADDGYVTLFVGGANRTAANTWVNVDDVKLSPGVQYPAPSDTTICSGSASPVFSITSVVGGGGSVTYQWQHHFDGASVWDNIEGATSSSYDPGNLTYSSETPPAGINSINSNSYRCVVTGIGDCGGSFCTSPSVVRVVAPAADKMVSAAASVVCPDTGTNIQVLLSGIGVSYQLKTEAGVAVGDPVVGTGSTIDLPTGNLTEATQFKVEATVTSCGTITMTEHPTVSVAVPAAPTAAADSSRCGTGEVSFQVTPDAGCSVKWYDAATDGNLVSSANPYTTSISATTTYYAASFNAGGCESATRTACTATVNALPSTPTGAAATPDTLCNGESSTLAATAGDGGDEVYWFSGSCGGTAVGDGTAGDKVVSPTTTTTYYARTKNSTTGCFSELCAEVTVTVNDKPAVPTDGAPTADTTTSITWKWSDVATETGYRVKDGTTSVSGDLAADLTQWQETTGIAANTQYTRYIFSFNGCGESTSGSTGQTKYSLQVVPTTPTISLVGTDSFKVSVTGPENLSAGSSGVIFHDGSDRTKVSALFEDLTGLTANTQYTYKAKGVNGDAAETDYSSTASIYTLASSPSFATSGPVAIDCDKGSSNANCAAGSNITFTFANSFGDGGNNAGQLGYLWDQTSGDPASWEEEVLWTEGATLVKAAGAADESYYLHIRSYNNDATKVTGDAVLNLGPYTSISGCTGATIEGAGQPTSQTVCEGGSATFTVTPTGTPSFTYQWNKSTDSGANWTPVGVGDGTVYAGELYTTFTPVNATTGMNGYQYQCLVVNCGGSSTATSNTVTLTVNSPPNITVHPQNAAVCSPDTHEFSVTADNAAGYQWFAGTPSTGTLITDAVASTYTTGVAGAYYCVVSGASPCASATSDAATLTVNTAPSITANPQDAAVCSPGTHEFSVTADNATSYQWYSGTPGSGTIITDATASTYTTGVAGSYYCVASGASSCASATSTAATLTVNTAPSITADPQNAAVCSPDTHEFSVTADNATGYQWYSGEPGSGTIIPDATASTYTTGVAGSYYCVVSGASTCANATSAAATLTVNTAPGAPTDGTPVMNGADSITWKWEAVSGATGYRVKDGETVLSGDLGAVTEWTETGLTANTSYTRKVYAFTGTCEGAGSTGQSRYTMIEKPTGVSFGGLTATSIEAGPAGTLTNVGAGSSAVWTELLGGANSGWVPTAGLASFSGLSANTAYTFVSKARNGDGVEPSSAGSYPGTYNGTITLGADDKWTGDANDAAINMSRGVSNNIGIGQAIGGTNFFASGISFEAWINTASSEDSNCIIGLSQASTNNTNPYIMFYVKNNASPTLADLACTWRYQTGQTAQGIQSLTPCIPASTWKHVAVTIPNGAGVQAKLYVDGAQVHQVTVYGVAPTTTYSYNYLGFTVNNGAYQGFGGSMDDVAIYNKVLSASEVAAHFAAGSSSQYAQSVSESTPTAYYRLGEPNGTNAATYASPFGPSDVKYTAQVTPTAPTFSSVTDTGFRVSTTGPVNVTSGSSGVFFNDGVDRTKVAALYEDVTGLTSNTQYTFKAKGVNAEDLATDYSATSSQFTLAAVPTQDVNFATTANTTAWYGSATWPGLTNPQGFGTDGKVSSFKYKWSTNAADAIVEADGTAWSSGLLTATPATPGSGWYLYLRSYNADNAGNGSTKVGPFKFDGAAPTPAVAFSTSATSTGIKINFGTGSDGESGLAANAYKVTRGSFDSGWVSAAPVTDSAEAVSAGETVTYTIITRDAADNESSVTVTARKPLDAANKWIYSTCGTTLAPPGVWPIAPSKVFAGSGDYRVHAMSSADGSLLWSPVVANGSIQGRCPVANFGTGPCVLAGSQDTYVYKIDVATGVPAWSVSLGAGNKVQGKVSGQFGANVDGTTYNLLFAGTDNIGTQTDNFLRAINAADGSTVWTFQGSPEGSRIDKIKGDPCVDPAKNTVYFTSYSAGSTSQPSVWAVSTNHVTPVLKWSASPGDVSGSCSLSPDGSTLYVGTTSGTLCAYNTSNGALRWSRVLDAGNAVYGAPYYFSGRIYVATIAGKLWCVNDSDGSVSNIWGTTNSGYVSIPNPSQPLVYASTGSIYLGSSDGKLYQVSLANGSFVSKTIGFTVGDSAIDVSTSYIYCGATDGRIYAFQIPF